MAIKHVVLLGYAGGTRYIPTIGYLGAAPDAVTTEIGGATAARVGVGSATARRVGGMSVTVTRKGVGAVSVVRK